MAGGDTPWDGGAGLLAGARLDGGGFANPGSRLESHCAWQTAPSRQWGLFGVVPKHRPSPHGHGQAPSSPRQGAGARCSHRPVRVLQSQGAISQVSPSPGTPCERQGGAGASLKAGLGPSVWVQGEERAGVIGSHRPGCQTGDRRTQRDPPDGAR